MGDIVDFLSARENEYKCPVISMKSLIDVISRLIEKYEIELDKIIDKSCVNFKFDRIWFDQYGCIYFLKRKSTGNYKTVVQSKKGKIGYTNFFRRIFSKPTIGRGMYEQINQFYLNTSDFFNTNSFGPYLVNGKKVYITLIQDKIVFKYIDYPSILEASCGKTEKIFSFCFKLSRYSMPKASACVDRRIGLEMCQTGRVYSKNVLTLENFEILRAILNLRIPKHDLPEFIGKNCI